jgi:acid phosphatase
MKKVVSIFVVFLVSSVFVFSQNSGMIVNLHDAKKAVKDYYSSGKYETDLQKCIDEALLNLSQIDIPKNAAFVFDVDETALSNWSYEINYDFGYIKRHWDEWVDSAKAPAIPHVKRFYDSLVAKNIKIIFITGRKHNQYDLTYQNLVNEGYTKIDTLICKPTEYSSKKAVEYKSTKRRELSSKYRIIGSIGDQWSDLEGGWTILKVKLPNYMYFIE